MKSKLTKFGVVSTVAYCVLVIYLCVIRWSELEAAALNNLGDFFAGAFGPLAVFWLVLGYFQQGAELRNNIEALNLQAKELKHSVEAQQGSVLQQGKLVEIAYLEAETNKRAVDLQIRQFDELLAQRQADSQPYLNLQFDGSSGGDGVADISYKLSNAAAPCFDITATVTPENLFLNFPTIPELMTDSMKTFSSRRHGLGSEPTHGTISIAYRTKDGVPGSQSFDLDYSVWGQVKTRRHIPGDKK